MPRRKKIRLEIKNFSHQSDSAKELLEKFLKEKQVQNLSEQTLKIYRTHCMYFLEDLSIDDTTPAWKACTQENYNQYILDLQQSDMKDVSIASYARSLRAWFYWLMNNNCITEFTVIIPKYQKTIPATYTDEELATILKKPQSGCTEVEYETWVFINVAIATGLRLSSILALKVCDICFSENTINVNRTKTRISLSLVVNDELLDILKTYIRIFELEDNDFLFCTGEKTPLARRSMESYVTRYLTKRQISKSHAVHAFRHTFAKNYYMQCHDMYRLKELMGHSTISTTEIYLRSLGLSTSKKIEYNPQALFKSVESQKKKTIRKRKCR